MSDGFTAVWRITYNALPRLIAGMDAKAGMIVAKAAHDIEAVAKTGAPIDTGTLRNSIQARMVSTLHWIVTVGADYGLFVEWGTYKMAAQPYLGPAVAQVRPEFLAAMRTVVTP